MTLDGANDRCPNWLCRTAIVVLVLVLFAPSISFPFSGWDEQSVLVKNPRLNQPSLDGLMYYWAHAEYDLYIPVTQTAWWLTAHFARTTDEAGEATLSAWPFRAINIALHALAGVMCFELLRALTRKPTASLLGAAVFVVHPLQVETVCWVAATKDLLAGMLSLAALTVHARSVEKWQNVAPPARWKPIAVSTLLCLLAALSKPSAIVLPAGALVIDWFWFRLGWRDGLKRALPWIIVLTPVAIAAKMIQPGYPPADYGIFARITVASFTLAFYLQKLIWPIGLTFDYGKTPEVVIAGNTFWRDIAIIAAMAMTAAVLWRRFRAAGVGAMLFAIALGTVLGLVPFTFQIYSTVGDHYVYWAMAGVGLIVASAARWRAAWAGMFVLIAMLSLLSARQVQVWRDAESVARHNMAVNPDSWGSVCNVVVALGARGDVEAAIELAQQAVAMRDVGLTRKTLAEAMVLRGDAEAVGGNPSAAIETYHQAIEIYPRSPLVWTNLAATLAETGRLDEALEAYRKASDLDPANPTAAAGIAAVRRAMSAK